MAARGKNEGSLLKGFGVAFLVSGVGSATCARILGGVTAGRQLGVGPKSSVFLAVLLPALLLGHQALGALSAGRRYEWRGLVLGTISGVMAGFFLVLILGMAKTRML